MSQRTNFCSKRLSYKPVPKKREKQEKKIGGKDSLEIRPIIQAIWEARAGRLQVQGLPGHLNHTWLKIFFKMILNGGMVQW